MKNSNLNQLAQQINQGLEHNTSNKSSYSQIRDRQAQVDPVRNNRLLNAAFSKLDKLARR